MEEKRNLIFIATVLFLFSFICFTNSILSKEEVENREQQETGAALSEIFTKYSECFYTSNWLEIEKPQKHHVVTVTIYNPVKGQCDSNPLITADGSKIDIEKLEAGELRWCAVSRDLLEDYPYGSIVRIVFETGEEEEYEVRDTMSERFQKYVDLLVPERITTGKWSNVKLYKTRENREEGLEI